MIKIRRLLTAAGVGLSLVAAPVHAQTLFTGSGCSGNTFLFCASWTATWIDNTHMSLLLTNTSQNAPSNNPLSAFTQVAIGNLNIADPTSMATVAGWQLNNAANAFVDVGLAENQFGANTTSGMLGALTGGNSLTFTFAFGGSVSFADAQLATTGAQLAIRDQGFLQAGGCTSKGLLVGSTSGQNTSSVAGCGNTVPSVVPEPSTYALVVAGLAGIFAVARRRRTA